MPSHHDPLDKLADLLNSDRETVANLIRRVAESNSKELDTRTLQVAREAGRAAGLAAVQEDIGELKAFQGNVKKWRVYTIAVVVVMGGLGVLHDVREAALARIYPPQSIYDKIDKGMIAKDTVGEETFKAATSGHAIEVVKNPQHLKGVVANPEIRKSIFQFAENESFDRVTLDNLPRINEEVSRIDKENDRLAENLEVRWAALGEEITKEEVLKMLVAAVDQRTDQLLAEIDSGEMEEEDLRKALDEVLGRKIFSSMIQTFTPVGESIWEIPYDAEARQAVLVVGAGHPKYELFKKYYRESSFMKPIYPYLFVTLTREGVQGGAPIGLRSEPVRIIGLETGKGDDLVVRVSQAVAKELNLPGAERANQGTGKGHLRYKFCSWDLDGGDRGGQ